MTQQTLLCVAWQTRLRKLFKLAKVANGHAHRFRDTFGVELLLAGIPIERVSVLLGHQKRKSDREALQPVGTITSGTIGSGLRESVVARSTCTSRDRGGAAVTRPLGSFQDIKSGHKYS